MNETRKENGETPRKTLPVLRLTLPLPPGINEQYATVNGRRVSTTVARQFKRQVTSILHTLERQGHITEELRTLLRQHYLTLLLDFYFPTPHRRDLDGGLKITQDALCEGLHINNNRVGHPFNETYRPTTSSFICRVRSRYRLAI
ncbi:MAG TPA: hypothetical protein VL461_07935 [Dictyobacter sp.]|jgi:crossover junction endodeoxyribonuclease RusA|nr:hypothetical protein [Dictyobacter sp.]